MEKRKFPEPQPFSKAPRPQIMLAQIESHKIAAVGYDAATKTLAVQFCSRGPCHFYHYPNVEPEVHEAFMAAESKGKFFGQHIQGLPFEKFPAEVREDEPEAQPQEAASAAD